MPLNGSQERIVEIELYKTSHHESVEGGVGYDTDDHRLLKAFPLSRINQ